MTKTVTERDFRHPEFADAKVEDYEFRRSDGKLVRKDRWEMAVKSIAASVMDGSSDWEIPDVIAAVEKLAEEQDGWLLVEDTDSAEYPRNGQHAHIKTHGGSVLMDARFVADIIPSWEWRKEKFTMDGIHAFKIIVPAIPERK